MPNNLILRALIVALPLASVTTTFGNTISGPSSSESPYLVRTKPGVVTKSILTVGDAVNYKADGVTPYRLVIPSDTLELVAEHDPDRFAPGGADFLTNDEESSGVIPAFDILGEGWYLMDVQAHYGLTRSLSKAANSWRSISRLARRKSSCPCVVRQNSRCVPG